jgi:hypothetical protein
VASDEDHVEEVKEQDAEYEGLSDGEDNLAEENDYENTSDRGDSDSDMSNYEEESDDARAPLLGEVVGDPMSSPDFGGL